ncbi:MAG TPA: hemin uptake protein HemP [Stellaceae bacterium]|nr:hemin uptake protein HemP [Stellaceae bacterium]
MPDSPPRETRLPPPAADRPVISSRDLLAGQREVIIRHGQDLYRLRLTSSNKLILIK